MRSCPRSPYLGTELTIHGKGPIGIWIANIKKAQIVYMKNYLHRLILPSAGIACLALGLTLPSHAQDQQPGFYIKGDIGGNLTQETSLREFFGPVAPGSKVKFVAGLRQGFAGGHNFTDWFVL